MKSGTLFVITTGVSRMLRLPAGSSDSALTVSQPFVVRLRGLASFHSAYVLLHNFL